MKQITNKEYEEWLKYKSNVSRGRILTPDGLRTICSAYEYNPEKIGKHFLELLSKITANEGIIDDRQL